MSVCLLATLHKNFQTDLHEIFGKVGNWPTNKWLNLVVIWITIYRDCFPASSLLGDTVNGHSFILIRQMAALVRCALAEVCTVPVLLVFFYGPDVFPATQATMPKHWMKYNSVALPHLFLLHPPPDDGRALLPSQWLMDVSMRWKFWPSILWLSVNHGALPSKPKIPALSLPMCPLLRRVPCKNKIILKNFRPVGRPS